MHRDLLDLATREKRAIDANIVNYDLYFMQTYEIDISIQVASSYKLEKKEMKFYF